MARESHGFVSWRFLTTMTLRVRMRLPTKCQLNCQSGEEIDEHIPDADEAPNEDAAW